uniref:Uncharacterized protein n=1 Tax=Arundo donax TaxID=35708 RepID=A0A0A8ZQ13_ARUDO
MMLYVQNGLVTEWFLRRRHRIHW